MPFQNFTVHITQNQITGSGILWLPRENQESIFIFTARHCLKGFTFLSDITINLFDVAEGKMQPYQCADDEGHEVYFVSDREEDPDIAIIRLPRSAFPSVSPTFEMLEDWADLKTCKIVGFPNANEGLKMLDGTFRQFRTDRPDHFDVNVAKHEDLSTMTNDGLENAQGMSGGGVFFECGGIQYLAGILIEYSNGYKDFKAISLAPFCQLLVQKQLPTPSFSFANGIGLNRNWFDRHVQKAIEDLGTRYTAKLNFELPIAANFNGLARNDVFKTRIESIFHQFLQRLDKNSRHLTKGIEPDFVPFVAKQRNAIRQFYNETDWSPKAKLFMDGLFEQTTLLKKRVESESAALFEKRRVWSESQQPEKRNYSNEPYSNELYHIRELRIAIHSFKEEFDENHVRLAQNNSLILHGKAGQGKSHLLGDVAKQQNNGGIPVILVLGNQLLQNIAPWQQILANLGLSCSSNEFLKTLDELGQRFGQRILFLVDAINEGGGKDFWNAYLAGFIADFKPFQHIGLVLAVRDTYFKSIFPESVLKDPSNIQIEHRGFEGHQLAALKRFCQYYGLEQPRFPILSTEFTNPQLLHLLCQSLKSNGIDTLPEGGAGIRFIYDGYLKAVNARISKQLDISENGQIVHKALVAFASKLAESQTMSMEHLSAEEVFTDFNRIHGSRLFQALIKENVLHEDRIWEYEKQEEKDVVRFGYERLGDFMSVKHLLDINIDPSKAKAAFAKDGFFAAYFSNRLYLKRGQLEILSVLLPEIYGLEIFQLLKVIKLDDYTARSITETAIQSLKWRSIEKMDAEKVLSAFNPYLKKYNLYETFWLAMLEMAPIPNHPFNADRLHKNLASFSMAERDRWWSVLVSNFYGEENFAIHRQLSWIWATEDFEQISDESTRLTAVFLAWMLTTTNQSLRDHATLSLVRLLTNRPETMLKLLQQFENVDEPYVQERLFAVAFGVTTCTNEPSKTASLAQYVYDRVFKNGEPPVHILLRDYARSTVEFALFHKLPVIAEAHLIRPPYGSKLPDAWPTEDEIQKFKIDYESEEYKSKPCLLRGQLTIESSVLKWGDFNRYVIESGCRHFNPVPLPFQKEYDIFKNELPRGTKSDFKGLEKANEMLGYPGLNKKGINPEAEKLKGMVQSLHLNIAESLSQKLLSGKKEIFENVILPHFEAVVNAKAAIHSDKKMDTKPIARWIFNRVFELGWRADWHGEFDDDKSDHSNNANSKIERIGKKYQWIAFHEIMARLADNHLMAERYAAKNVHYEGTWEPFLRNIDPTYPILNSDSPFATSTPAPKKWWHPPIYEKWDEPDWVNKLEDLPDPRALIELTDKEGQKWLSLINMPDWAQKPMLGADDHTDGSRRLWYQLRAYFMPEKNAGPAFEWLSKQDFMGNWMPKEQERYELFEREFYWSPGWKSFQKIGYHEGQRDWKQWEKSRFKSIIPIAKFQSGGGSFLVQGGGFYKPAEYLWQKMNLRYGSKTGDFFDEHGQLACFDPTVGQSGDSLFLIKKEPLLRFLQKNGLALSWTLLGQKVAHQSFSRFSLGEIFGAYRLKPNGDIEGGIRLHNDFGNEPEF